MKKIITADNVFTKQECHEIIFSHLSDNNFRQGSQYGDDGGDYFSSYRSCHVAPGNTHYGQKICQITMDLARQFEDAATKGFCYNGFDFLKYEPGQKFSWHTDDKKAPNRALSFVIYLNDDYRGGETEFRAFNSYTQEHNVSRVITPKQGSILAFTSKNLSHRSAPVLTKVKYALVSWLIDGFDLG